LQNYHCCTACASPQYIRAHSHLRARYQQHRRQLNKGSVDFTVMDLVHAAFLRPAAVLVQRADGTFMTPFFTSPYLSLWCSVLQWPLLLATACMQDRWTIGLISVIAGQRVVFATRAARNAERLLHAAHAAFTTHRHGTATGGACLPAPHKLTTFASFASPAASRQLLPSRYCALPGGARGLVIGRDTPRSACQTAAAVSRWRLSSRQLSIISRWRCCRRVTGENGMNRPPRVPPLLGDQAWTCCARDNAPRQRLTAATEGRLSAIMAHGDVAGREEGGGRRRA